MGVKGVYITAFLVLSVFVLNAQKGYVRLKSFQRIAYQNKASFAWSGAAIAGGYTYKASRKDLIDFGAELGFLEWGAQALPEIGYRHNFHFSGFKLSAGAAIYNGVVLFRPKPFYSFGAQAQGGILGAVTRRLDMGFFTGVRYSITPQYRNYSPIFYYWHFSTELVFIFKKPIRSHGGTPSF